MIGYLDGEIKSLEQDKCLLVVSGVGYEVVAHGQALQRCQLAANQVFYIHHHIREDGQCLYGFLSARERDLFRIVIQMQGVGPKLGLVICGSISEEALLRAVADKDVARFKCIKGVGARMAERLVVELKPKLAKWQPILTSPSLARDGDVIGDVIEALAQLGYTSGSLMDMVRSLFEPGMTSDALLKKSLRSLAKC
tara:strand:- start:681 stop:1268 length:588 start_codon:yes stop_codon:yes gene_type:complete